MRSSFRSRSLENVCKTQQFGLMYSWWNPKKGSAHVELTSLVFWNPLTHEFGSELQNSRFGVPTYSKPREFSKQGSQTHKKQKHKNKAFFGFQNKDANFFLTSKCEQNKAISYQLDNAVFCICVRGTYHMHSQKRAKLFVWRISVIVSNFVVVAQRSVFAFFRSEKALSSGFNFLALKLYIRNEMFFHPTDTCLVNLGTGNAKICDTWIWQRITK